MHVSCREGLDPGLDALEERDIGERVGEVAGHDGLRLLEGEGGLDSRGKVPQRRGGDPGRAREVFRCVVLRAPGQARVDGLDDLRLWELELHEGAAVLEGVEGRGPQNGVAQPGI